MQTRLATPADLPALTALMERSIDALQAEFLTPDQVAASRMLMGLDTQLVADGTYFVVEDAGVIAGCGGWSQRATLYGGDHSPGRAPALLDPATDAARVRAMYTDPAFARRGVGRMVLAACERAAASAGFARGELVATLAGHPLYLACGWRDLERFEDDRGGVPVPLIRMGKALAPTEAPP
jgi:GNAT superfamily N-acetyltransferase